MNFVFTDEHKKRRLDVLDLSEHERAELEEYYQNGSKTKTEVLDHFKQKWPNKDRGLRIFRFLKISFLR